MVIKQTEVEQYNYSAFKGGESDFLGQGNRVLTKEHLEEIVFNPASFKPFTLEPPFESGLLL